MKYSEKLRKVSPFASRIYKECKKSGMTVEEFHMLARLLCNIYSKLMQVNNERKLNEYCNELVTDVLKQNNKS